MLSIVVAGKGLVARPGVTYVAAVLPKRVWCSYHNYADCGGDSFGVHTGGELSDHL
jgi:hypothetical protein